MRTIIYLKEMNSRERRFDRKASTIVSPHYPFNSNASTGWRRKRRKQVLRQGYACNAVASRDSPRLFAESEEVCRYKYNAFLSHRLEMPPVVSSMALEIVERWRVFAARPRRKDADFQRAGTSSGFIIRSVRTRRKSVRDFASRAIDRSRARVLSFSFKPTEPPSIEIASAFPPDRCLPPRMTYTSSKNWKVH